ncbi:MAG TPA: helix-turn-helix domain-containing protein [Gallionellaceae bacterium]
MLTNALQTSINAYQAQRAGGRARGQCLLLLNFIRDSQGDWSIGELAQALEMDKSTVSARVFELLHDSCELEARPRRKDRVSGILVRPVGIPVAPAPRAGEGA